MRFSVAFVVLASAVCGLALGVAVISLPAEAGTGSTVAAELARDLPAVGPGFTESWVKTCTTASATTIVPAGVRVDAFECTAPESTETDATQMVAIGDSGIADPAVGTRNSGVICGSGCHKNSRAINARQAYCRTDTDDVLIYCWAVTSPVVATQP